MAPGERSIAEVFQDIVGNIQNIVRSEVQLAKSELLVELTKLKAAAPLLIFGGVAALLAALFLVWTIVYALAVFVPMWGAALIVTTLLAITGGLTLTAALKRLRKVDPPKRTIATIKENVQWAKQQVK